MPSCSPDDIVKRDYAPRVIELRQRYWLLSVPTDLWTKDETSHAGL